MMFGPLADIFDKHAKTAVSVLQDIRQHLGTLVQNTTATTVEIEYGDFSGSAEVGEDGTAEVILKTIEGYYWRLNQTAVTGTDDGACAVYSGSVRPENLIDVITPTGKNTSQAKYYVAPHSSLIFHFYEQTPGETCTAHIQVKRFVQRPDVTDSVSISHDVSEVDLRLSEPERHRVPRTQKPNPSEIAQTRH